MYAPLAEKICNNCKVAVAMLNYRLSCNEKEGGEGEVFDGIVFPYHVLDIAAAIVYLYAHGDELQFDSKRIFLGGHSAGGNMTSLILLNEKMRGYSEKQRSSEVWHSIKGVCGVSGIYDLAKLSKDYPSYHPYFLDAAFPPTASYDVPYFDSKGEKAPVTLDAASPINYKSEEAIDVHFLLIHSANEGDEYVNTAQAHSFHEYLRGFVKKVTIDTTLEGTHFGILENEGLITILSNFFNA
jgi:acetyl esterase/lipase